MSQQFLKDLIVQVADKDMQAAVQNLLSRSQALGVSPIAFDVQSEGNHDSFVRQHSQELLRKHLRTHRYAIVLFDWHGSAGAQPRETPKQMAADVNEKLAQNGWANRSETIVIQPELEVWLWGTSSILEDVLEWSNQAPQLPPLREWLATQGLWTTDRPKPQHPKEAWEAALRQVRRPKSPPTALARQVPLDQCQDPAFRRLKSTLRKWFPRSR